MDYVNSDVSTLYSLQDEFDVVAFATVSGTTNRGSRQNGERTVTLSNSGANVRRGSF